MRVYPIIARDDDLGSTSPWSAVVRQRQETTMRNKLAIAAAALMMLNGNVLAAQLPTYEISGFPVTPHQASVIGSPSVQEKVPNPDLTANGMPASPHQIQVLTPGGE